LVNEEIKCNEAPWNIFKNQLDLLADPRGKGGTADVDTHHHNFKTCFLFEWWSAFNRKWVRRKCFWNGLIAYHRRIVRDKKIREILL